MISLESRYLGPTSISVVESEGLKAHKLVTEPIKPPFRV
jgi:hypothetical protein